MRVNLTQCVREYHDLIDEYNSLMDRHNDLVERVNDKGGEDFLKNAVIPDGNDMDLNDKDIKDLLMLCHPDRHSNSARATRVTRKLIILKKREFYY